MHTAQLSVDITKINWVTNSKTLHKGHIHVCLEEVKTFSL